MRCPNCSAEASDQALECDFCGHQFIDGAGLSPPASPPAPPAPDNPGRATFTASEPTYAPPPRANYSPPPVQSENPYEANYPSASKLPRESYAKGSVPNNLLWAILATLCCCLPAGIVAIIYAAQVDGKLASGDYQGAVDASNNAKMWSWISFGASAVVGVLYFLAIMIGGVADQGRY